MILARVESQGKIYFTELRDGKYYPLDGDFFNYKMVAKTPISGEPKLLAPVIPGKVVALGLNYMKHIEEFKDKEHPEPVIFIKPSESVIGPGDAIVRPKRTERMDYEAELAFVISKDCRRITPKEAPEYILGYTCLNDVTARDLQKVDGQWTRAKGYDTFCPIGPWIVTGIDPSALEVKATLNGEVKQLGNTSEMINGVYETLSFISSVMTLKKGDVISTGTPSGIGPMSAGDIIEISVEKVGILRNIVIDE